MTTLEAIGFTLAGGAAVFGVTLGLFGIAVAKRSIFIAPRATARPRNVIYNPRPNHSCQDRGNPMLGWIRWTLGLTYDTLLRGVPGTGTREGGLSGSMLKVTMEGVILLRFHALGLRVTFLTTVLCLAIILPVYITAPCYNLSDEDAEKFPGCQIAEHNITNYEQTTLANVPALTNRDSWKTFFSPFHGVLGRMYAVTVVFWIIVAYILHQLRQEWIQMLAMRRVYYLEQDVWGERRKELKETLLYAENAALKKKGKQHFTFDEIDGMKVDSTSPNQNESDEDHLTNREPWIPHPEQRDTVPCVGLYSVLVGGLPSLPEQAADAFDTEATINFSKRECIDWQLLLTRAFFDHCVPNQPGFSSSVAAVTIIPGAKDIALAWKKWYAAAAKLRRLRFIRKQIAQRRYFEIEVDDSDEECGELDIEKGDPEKENEPEGLTPRGVYHNPTENKAYFKQVLGSMLADEQGDSIVHESLDFGPEQMAVYSREFAQAAAPCCPNGCNEGRVRRAAIDELLELEQEAAAEVHQANLELKEARRKATRAEHGPEQQSEPEKSEVNAPPPTQAPPSSAKKGHRKKPSLEGANLPANLALEADLYNAMVDKDAAHHPLKKEHVAVIRESSSLHQKPSTSPESVAAKTVAAPPSYAEKGHRTKPSLDGRNLPSNLALEADLYNSMINKDAAHHPPQEEHMAVIRESSSLHQRPSTSRESEAATTAADSSGALLPAHFEPEEDVVLLASSAKWAQVEGMVEEARNSLRSSKGLHSDRSDDARIATGVWQWPSLWSAHHRIFKKFDHAMKWAKVQSSAAVDQVARETTYAVVTFTSRQAAVAARSCLADGRGHGRWMTLSNIPVPPLADAAPCDLCACRNCCRPVTVSISERQKNFRHYVALFMLAVIYIFYTIPLTAASSLVDPGSLDQLFPRLAELNVGFGHILAGLITATIWSIFFALCPIMFKSIANFGSKATSIVSAEYSALKYYWWFMVLTAFTGNFLAQMFLNGLNNGLKFGSEFRSVLRAIAATLPSGIAATWLNWIILRFTVILPWNYLLQGNTFLFYALGWKCCSRLVRGGGPGGPIPYRIYVDGGVVLMCAFALAPVSPLVAPACFLYFLLCQPLLRRNVIYIYRPRFDGGGLRWPFIFQMCFSALIVGEVCLFIQLLLKAAIGPTILAGLTLVPTILVEKNIKNQYLQAFEDAALLQTSQLDGWDTSAETSMNKREEFRRFLVDAHKAAYVPVCLASADTDDFLTAEPAVVVPHDSEMEKASDIPGEPLSASDLRAESVVERQSKKQHGATLRRAVNMVAAMQRRGSLSGRNNSNSRSLNEDDFSIVSPFEKSSSRRDLYRKTE